MDYARPDLADRLAAEYVLGTLRGPARRRFQALMGAHPALHSAVQRWEAQLAPLSESVVPVLPPAHVWKGVETRLFGTVPAAKPLPWWNALGLWRALSALATAAAVALVFVVPQATPPQPPIVVVLATNPEAAGFTNASFVASLSADGRALVLKPLNAPMLTAAQSSHREAPFITTTPRSTAPTSTCSAATSPAAATSSR
jgi:anti-sigma-K factor RskA